MTDIETADAIQAEDKAAERHVETLDDDELEVLREFRERKARKAEIAGHWKICLADLTGGSEAPGDDDEEWDEIAGRFCTIIDLHGWEIEFLAFALMRALGWREHSMRNHGMTWVRR
jgi:hypothetical protein